MSLSDRLANLPRVCYAYPVAKLSSPDEQPYFVRAVLTDQAQELGYKGATCQCPLCGGTTILPVALVMTGKYPPGIPRRRTRRLAFRSAHIMALFSQIENILITWRNPRQ